jgi:integrase
MGRVFRRTAAKPLPTDAMKKRNSKGALIATWTTRGRTFSGEVLPCGTKYRWKAERWSIEYLPYNKSEPVVEATPCTDKAWAERYLREIETREANRRLGIFDASHDRKQEARSKPLSEHIDEYVADLRNTNRTSAHVRDVGTKLRSLFAEAHIQALDEIQLSAVRTGLAALTSRKGLSDRTRNHYVAKLRGFINWLIDDDRLANNPLKKLKQEPVLERKRERRTLSPTEFQYLVMAAQTRTRPNQKVSGEDRVRLYYLMACTGYRKSEVASLTAASFSRVGEELFVTLAAKKGKNRKQDRKAIPSQLVDWLWQWLSQKTQKEPLFHLPHKLTKSLRRDMQAGRELWISEAANDDERRNREATDFLAYKNSDGFYADNHAFRHTYCTEVQRIAPSPKVALGLQRHCDTKMGANYWHSSEHEEALVQHEIGRRLPAPTSLRRDS